MKKLKVLHAADIHARDKNIDEIETCLNFLIGKAQGVDLVVFAGDCFDSRDIKLDSRAAKLMIKTVSELADICPVVIVKGTESHDGNAPEVLQYARGAHEIFVATRPTQIKMVGESLILSDEKNVFEPDAVITLIPQPTKQYFNQGSISESNESISQGMTALFAGFGAQASQFKNAPHVLIGHWNVSGARLSTGQTLTGQDIDISVDQMMLAEPSLVCLGHIHLPQTFTDRIFYSGSLIPLSWGENHKHGFMIHELEGKNLVSSEYVETPYRKLLRFSDDFTQAPIDGIDRSVYSHNKDELAGAIVRHDITVWQDESSKIDKYSIRDAYMRGGALDADIRIIRVPRQTVRSESVLKVETLREKIVAMAALNDETVPESILQKADALENELSEDIIEEAAA